MDQSHPGPGRDSRAGGSASRSAIGSWSRRVSGRVSASNSPVARETPGLVRPSRSTWSRRSGSRRTAPPGGRRPGRRRCTRHDRCTTAPSARRRARSPRAPPHGPPPLVSVPARSGRRVAPASRWGVDEHDLAAAPVVPDHDRGDPCHRRQLCGGRRRRLVPVVWRGVVDEFWPSFVIPSPVVEVGQHALGSAFDRRPRQRPRRAQTRGGEPVQAGRRSCWIDDRRRELFACRV